MRSSSGPDVAGYAASCFDGTSSGGGRGGADAATGLEPSLPSRLSPLGGFDRRNFCRNDDLDWLEAFEFFFQNGILTHRWTFEASWNKKDTEDKCINPQRGEAFCR